MLKSENYVFRWLKDITQAAYNIILKENEYAKAKC